MYSLILKSVNLRSLTTCRIRFTRSYSEKEEILTILKMPNNTSSKAERNVLESSKRSDTRDFSSSVHIQVIGSGAAGGPSSVLLISNGIRYLINCGEGTQKLGNEYRLNLEKLSNIFITYPSWKNVSGLLGLCLSVESARITELLIHGHSCIGNIFSAVTKFVHVRDLELRLKNCTHNEEFLHEMSAVKYVCLFPSSYVNLKKNFSDSAVATLQGKEDFDIENEFELNNTEKYVSSENHYSPHLSKKTEKVTSTSNKHKKKRIHSESNAHTKFANKELKQCAISFIFRTKETSGALNFNKCVEFGVPPGPLLGKLKRGEDVELSDGKIVRSVDVKEPDVPGVIVIAVECPSEDYLDSLLEEPAFHAYQSDESAANAVIHFSSTQVVKNIKYQEWIGRFSKTTKHLFINEDNKRSGSVGIQRQQYKLNFLHPGLFPLLDNAGIPDFPRLENCTEENGHTVVPVETNSNNPQIYSDQTFYKCESNSYICGETLCLLPLKPKPEYDYSKCLVLKKEEFFNEMFKNDMKTKIEECKVKLKDIEDTLETDKRIYPKILFLGTGSSKPSKVRNASGILVFLNEHQCILLDCGESTYSQLVNFYGKQKAYKVLRKLDAIYISHLHVDHHMGFITLVKERKLAFDELQKLSHNESSVHTKEDIVYPEFKPVFLLAPVQIRRWLKFYNDEFEDISELYDILPNAFLKEDSKELVDRATHVKKSLNLRNLMTAAVCHCAGAFGVSIVHEDGWKLTYSGDTRPCDALVKLGMNSDILIHEATFEDAYTREAKIKLHSTTSQAIDIGKKMKAKYIILTHFSQRYAYLPVIDEKFNNLNIGVAFDFMEVPFNKLPLLPAIIEPLQYIFSEYNEKNKSTLLFYYLKRDNNEMNTSSKDSKEILERPVKMPKQSLKIDSI